jgi:uncharacterized protein YqjF (DUF2071 family)
MTQTWDDLLFAHWPIAADDLRRLIPAELTLDTYEGQAWVGIVPFKINGFRLRFILALPWLSHFLELNLRTYVIVGGKPGVYFFSLDAARLLAVIGARVWFHLPYFWAHLSMEKRDGWMRYTSRRLHLGGSAADLDCAYRPAGDVFLAEPGSLARWLTERYCLYALDGARNVYRAEIHHAQWPLQPAEMQIHATSLAAAHGIHLPDIPPLLYYARRLQVLFWPPVRVKN